MSSLACLYSAFAIATCWRSGGPSRATGASGSMTSLRRASKARVSSFASRRSISTPLRAGICPSTTFSATDSHGRSWGR
jgi:hypothetical protein